MPSRRSNVYHERVSWTVHEHPEVHEWLLALKGTNTAIRVQAAIDMLREQGPGLGRPVADTINASRHRNMKELRPGSVRILFAFDPERQAVLLVAGDKRDKWNDWYKTAIPLADDRFDEWLSPSWRRTETMSANTAATSWHNWDETRQQLGNDPERVAEARAELEAEIAAYRLAEIRKEQHRTQTELAKELGVTQRRVSEIESSELSRTEVRTISRYVEALGGKIRIVADFPGRTVTIR